MITPKIKALFQFIDYLHSNIENFKQFDELINELHLLDKERKQLNTKKNFKDKLKYDELQAEIKDKFNLIKVNIITPIRTKAIELNICNFQNEPLQNWNGVETEIHELKENFSKDDLPEIFSHKNKYLEYRTATKGEGFFGLGFFFDDLDELLKTLFDFFKESEQQNEFEAFETKAIQVNDLSEAVKLFKLGHKKFTLPNTILTPSTIQQQPNIEPLPTQPTKKPKPELTHDQIALKHVYEGLTITRANGNEIAKKYKQNSGERLFQKFTFYSSAANRKGLPTPCTPKKLANKIKLIESVIDLLPTDKQERAKDEVKILKSIYETEYQ